MENRRMGVTLLGGVLALALIGWAVYAFVFNGDKKEDSTDNNSKVVDNTDKNEDTNNNSNSNTNTGNDTNTNNGNTTTTTDFSTFSSNKQTVGDSTSTNTYRLDSITRSEEDGFYRTVFAISSLTDQTTQPYVTSTYLASSGAIRVVLNGVTKDNSGIGYQKSVDINKQGIIRLYHNISAKSTEELYDLGVSKSTIFKLSIGQGNTDKDWKVTLDVKYPGEVAVSIDLGSTEFSKNDQSITGATKAEGAKVTGYSYSSSGGVVKLVLTVAGSAEKPLPSVTAGYGNSGEITLRFPSLVSDAVTNKGNTLTISSGIKVYTNFSNGESEYLIGNVPKEFKLYGTTSPNQIILEFRL